MMEWDSSNNPTFAARRSTAVGHATNSTHHQLNNKLMIIIIKLVLIEAFAFGALWFVIQHSSLK